MYFVAEIEEEIFCRLMCDNHKGKLVNYKEVPISKVFGFIADHMFESRRDYENSSERYDETMISLFKTHPIEYEVIFKNVKNHDQGISTDVSDYQPLGVPKNVYVKPTGSGHGNNPSTLNRVFNKQLVIIFRFKDDPEWINQFKSVWTKRPIVMKGTMDVKKTVVDELEDVDFKFDLTKAYYTYTFTKSTTSFLNPNKMLYMFNTKSPKDSLYVEDLNPISITVDCVEDVLDEINLKSTDDILGE